MIVHVDGDSFFASCEIAQNERLRGKCVVTGFEKGIATSMSYEAKKRGISRGMTMRQIKELCPEAIITNSSYDIYRIYSLRMYKIVSRYAQPVEEYSVDECFGNLSFLKTYDEMIAVAHKIQNDLHNDLGMTFSLGLAPTKTLAKVASKWNKPAGFTVIFPEKIPEFLDGMQIGKIWGIGSRMSQHFIKNGVKTALDFYMKPESWVQEHVSLPYQEMWHELRGTSLNTVRPGNREKHKSIRKTRTFRPSRDKSYIFSELCKNIEQACFKLRAYGLIAKSCYFYLKTQQFQYYSSKELKFPEGVSLPHEVLRYIKDTYDKLFKENIEYRATGFIFSGTSLASMKQDNLFDAVETQQTAGNLYKAFDAIRNKYGPKGIALMGSLKARQRERKNKEEPQYVQEFLKLGIPYWGETKDAV